MSTQHDRAIKVLYQIEAWSVQADILGNKTINNINEKLDAGEEVGTISEQITSAEKMDLVTAVTIIASALIIIKTILDIYDNLKAKLNKKPTSNELKAAVINERVIEKTKLKSISVKTDLVIKVICEGELFD